MARIFARRMWLIMLFEEEDSAKLGWGKRIFGDGFDI